MNLTFVFSTVIIGCSTIDTRFSSSPSEVEELFPSTRCAAQYFSDLGDPPKIHEGTSALMMVGGPFIFIYSIVEYVPAIATDVLLLPMDGYWVWRKEKDGLLSIHQELDTVRNGIRMILRYRKASESFSGMVINVTEKPIQAVRVEVYLIDGSVLGPTPRMDLAPGQKGDILLPTDGQSFKLWKAYIESDVSIESGHSSEGQYN